MVLLLGGDQREAKMPLSLYHRLFIFALAVVLGAQTASANDQFQAAAQLYKMGLWNDAAQAFRRLAEDRHTDRTTQLTARIYVGECLIQLGEFAAARDQYQLVEQQGPPQQLAAQTLFRLGEATWLAGDRTTGQSLLRSYLNQYPQHTSVEYAENYLNTITEQLITAADFAALDKAVGLQRDGQEDAALAAYQQLIDRDLGGTLQAEALRRAGQLHDRLDHHREALRYYQQFLAEYPDSEKAVEIHSAIAWLHVRLDQTAQAAEQFGGVYANFPQSAQAVEAAYWLAQWSAEENNSQQALQYVDQVLQHEQVLAQGQKLLGRALCLKCQLMADAGDWQEVNRLVATAEGQLEPGHLRARIEFWAAEAALRLRDYDAARTRFDALQVQAIGLKEPWVAMVPLRRAQLAARRQQWSETLNILDQLERDHPDFQLDYEVHYLRGRALAGRGEMTSARRFYNRVLDNPSAVETETAVMAQWMIGETFFHQRDYQRARDAYEKVITQNTMPQWQARAALQAGKCCELQQQWDQASQVYTQALKRWQGTDSEQQLQSRLRWAQNQRTMKK